MIYFQVAVLIILGGIIAMLGFPFGMYKSIFGVQKNNCLSLGEDEFCFELSNLKKDGQNYTRKKVHLTSYDKTELVGEYHSFGNEKIAIFIHGYRTNPKRDFDGICQKFAERGYDVFLCFERAHGVSGGKFFGGGVAESKDLLIFTDWVEKNLSPKEIVLYGVSTGGSALSYASEKFCSDKIKSLVIDCAFTSYFDVMIASVSESNKFARFNIKLVCLAFKLLHKIDVTKKTYDSLKNNKIKTAFLYGEQDETVPYEQIGQNYDSNSSDKVLLVCPSGIHAKAFQMGGVELQKELFTFLG